MVPPTPAKCAPEPVYNQEKEPRKEEEPPLPPASGGGVLDQPRAWRSYPDDFEAFWSVYPLRVGKRAAGLVWAGAVKRAGSVEAIMAGLAVQQFDANPQYIPHPKTWLNRDGWLDEPRRKRTLAEEWNLTSFLAPVIDDEPLPPGTLLS